MTDERPVLLLVDDQPSNLKALSAVLIQSYRIKVATSGLDALILATHEPAPNLILLDVMMPDMDGYAVCAALKAAPATMEIPVIFITVKTDPESETQALNQGAVDFIHKPFNPAVVKARVQLQLTLQKQTRDLRAANVELARHRDHLEELVHARTLELAKARDAAESANRAKGAFLRNVSHEMRTPLNQITGMSHLLRREVPPGRSQERLTLIDQANRCLLDMINSVLDLAQLEAKQLELRPSQFEVREVVLEVAADYQAAVLAKDLGLDVNMDPAVPRYLTGDAARLRQILCQLLDNAVKFSVQGRIGLRVEPCEVSPTRVQLCFIIEDSGIGITPDVAGGLFECFRQGDDSLSRSHGGLGLGLALCQRLIALMGGEISLSSPDGQGTRVAFWVPLGITHARIDAH